MRERLPTLEFRLDKGLENQFSIPEQGHTITYIGRLFDLSFSGDSIYGNAYLEKIQEGMVAKAERKLAWIPLLHITRRTLRHNVVVDWNVGTSDNPALLYNDNDNSQNPEYYRVQLNNGLLEQGLKVSTELMDIVFNPLDKRLEEMYNQAILIR